MAHQDLGEHADRRPARLAQLGLVRGEEQRFRQAEDALLDIDLDLQATRRERFPDEGQELGPQRVAREQLPGDGGETIALDEQAIPLERQGGPIALERVALQLQCVALRSQRVERPQPRPRRCGS
ncbi:MAG: hypothetical protein R3D25_13795 [Geminicoccaceae bacterium]